MNNEKMLEKFIKKWKKDVMFISQMWQVDFRLGL